MSSFPHIDNKGKDILTFGKGPTEGLDEHSLAAEKLFSINFTKFSFTKFCKACITVEQIVICLLMVQK